MSLLNPEFKQSLSRVVKLIQGAISMDISWAEPMSQEEVEAMKSEFEKESKAMYEFLKIQVGKHIWLVPSALISDEFRSAVDKFNSTKDGEIVSLTDAEYEAFYRVNDNPVTWKPF